MCLDRYGRWELGHKFGTLVRQTRDSVWIIWDHEQDFEVWSQGDCRYEVERGRWRISAPQRGNPLEAIAGVRKMSPSPGAPALTLPNGDGKIHLSPISRDRQTEGGKMAESSTLSAKQVATKLGTDAKTFRRFLRSNSCSIEPVGQGGRYEFATKDVEKLKSQFISWRKPGASSTPTKAKKPSTAKETTVPQKRKKHTIDDDPPEVRFNSTIAQRQQGAEMANHIEKNMPDEDELADLYNALPDNDDEPSLEDLADLEAELEDINLDDLE